MAFRLDTTDMERHSVELRLFLDKAKRRFSKAEMMDKFEQIVKNNIANALENNEQENQTLRIERINADETLKLSNYLNHLIGKCQRMDQHELLQDSLRKSIMQSRQAILILKTANGELIEPMCAFCANDLPTLNFNGGGGQSANGHAFNQNGSAAAAADGLANGTDENQATAAANEEPMLVDDTQPVTEGRADQIRARTKTRTRTRRKEAAAPQSRSIERPPRAAKAAAAAPSKASASAYEPSALEPEQPTKMADDNLNGANNDGDGDDSEEHLLEYLSQHKEELDIKLHNFENDDRLDDLLQPIGSSTPLREFNSAADYQSANSTAPKMDVGGDILTPRSRRRLIKMKRSPETSAKNGDTSHFYRKPFTNKPSPPYPSLVSDNQLQKLLLRRQYSIDSPKLESSPSASTGKITRSRFFS